jgi:hypothetical protein
VTSSAPERSLRHFVRGPLLVALTGAVLIGLDPLGIEEATAERSEETVMRMSAAFYPPLLSQPSQVTVVLLDRDFVGRHDGDAWPVSYDVQGQLLDKIVSEAPAAVFVDLLYTDAHQEASAPGVDRDVPMNLLSRVENTQIPFYLASTAENGAPCRLHGSRDGDGAWIDKGRILPSIRRDIDNLTRGGFALIEWSGCPDEYPLYAVDEPTTHSPAYALYRAVECSRRSREQQCLDNWPDGQYAEPMKIRWGAFTPLTQNPFYAKDVCQFDSAVSGLGSAWRRIAVLGREWLSATVGDRNSHVRLRCPSVNVIPASAFFVEPRNDAALKEIIENKFILVGADIAGSSDIASTPVHGQVAGVIVHAMALDNLLRLNTDYLQEISDPMMHWIVGPLFLVLVAVLAYRARASRWQQPIELTGLVFLGALAVTCLREGRLSLTLLALVGGALLFVIAPTAIGRAVIWFGMICVGAVVAIELDHAPTNCLILAIAAVLVGEKVYHEMNGETEQQVVTARLAIVRRGVERLLGISKNPNPEVSGEVSHEIQSEIRIVRVRSAWYQRLRGEPRRVQHRARSGGNEQ